jgi:HK97 family phage prohead protease
VSQTARKSFAVEFKSVDDAEGIVDAIVNTTGLLDRQKDIIEPGAFRKAVNGKLPKVVNSHQGSDFLGKVLSMREIMPGDTSLPRVLLEKGLGAFAVKMQFNLETQAGREMFSNVKGGYVDEWSFMFTIADGQYDSKGVRHIKLIDEIFEVSPVLVGANQATLTLASKSARADLLDEAFHCASGYLLNGAHLKASAKPAHTLHGKYPISSCADVSDAWHLRGHSTLPENEVIEYIRRVASELHCEGPWNKPIHQAPKSDCLDCNQTKDIELGGDEAMHNEALNAAIDNTIQLIRQELGESESDPWDVDELVHIWLSYACWAMGEAMESESASPMQTYAATPDITATSALTARAIAAGIAAGRSRRR